MSPEIQLTKEMVDEVSGKLRSWFESRREAPWPGEFYDGVFQTLAKRLGLPQKDLGVAVVADWEDPRVKEFARQLKEFALTEPQVDPVIKRLKIPYPNMPESEFPEIWYAESLPDKGILLDITEFTQHEYKPSYLFAALVEQGEKRDIIFAPGPSHDKIQEALERNGLMGARFNHAQLSLTDMAEIRGVMLRNYWGETREAQRENLAALLGKINPGLFVQQTMFIGIVGSHGFDFVFNPVTAEMQDYRTKSVERVPQLF